MTGGVVSSTTQTQALRKYLQAECGVNLPDLQKGTVERALASGGLPEDAHRLLEMRQQASATSSTKYAALLASMCRDGRMRGLVQFRGAARTGRGAGRIFQPQNLPRTPGWFDGAVQEQTIASIKAGTADLLWDNVSERCSMSIRGALVAADGCKFAIADLSNIEGRVLAWLAGEQWKIEAFGAFDKGDGEDLYKIAAGRILGKDAREVTKDERQRIGKPAELSLGFGGSVGAFRKMGGDRVDDMSDEDIGLIVRAWRKAHPATVSYWYALEGAVRAAIRSPGTSHRAGDNIFADVRDGPDKAPYLRLRLPSGRYLCYREPQVDDGGECPSCGGTGDIDAQPCRECYATGGIHGTGRVTFMGLDQYTRKWGRLETYYGRLVENVVQAAACDVFQQGMVLAEQQGYAVVLQVHDELVCEVPDSPEFTAEGLSAIMSRCPAWARGLPLAAAGFEARKYRKE